MTRRWFITGGTPGGLGVAFAEAALETGDRVSLTSRRPQELAAWAEQYGDRVLVVPLDVTDAAQVRHAVQTVEDGFGGSTSWSTTPAVDGSARSRGWQSRLCAPFELNFFAVLSVARAVLTGMRARGSGWIVNVSSVAGLVAATGFGYYSATKFAIEAVTETLREEVAGQGISVLAVEPGAFRTNAYAGFADEPVAESILEYHDMLEQVKATFVGMDGVQPGDPRRGARAVLAAMAQDPPPRRLVLGNGGFDAVVDTLEGALADIRSNEELSRSADFPNSAPGG